MVTRDSNGHGEINVDPVRFPSGMAALADYIHSKGLKFGIYQAPGSVTPQGRPGLRNHEAQDVATFCAWGVPSPCHTYPDLNPDLTENYLRF
jgi:alpha-galactosidase